MTGGIGRNGVLGVFAFCALLAGCDPLTVFQGRVRSPAACGDEAPGTVEGAVVVISCPRTDDVRFVSDANGEFSLTRLSMLAGGCTFRAEKPGYQGAVVRLDDTCDACTMEVPLILECAPGNP